MTSGESAVPRLAVVIATRNRPHWALRVIADVQEQGEDFDEVILVDQSDDPQQDVLAQQVNLHDDSRLQMICSDPVGLPRARNLGWRAASAPVVLFLDDDVHLLPGCLRAHRLAFVRPEVGGVVGRIAERHVRPNHTSTTNRIGWGGRVRTNLWGDRRQPIQTLKGANMSIRRSALLQVDGFDPSYRGTALLEDADVSMRLREVGWQLWFEPAAELVHFSAGHGGVRVGSEARTEWWRFHNTAQFTRRHRGYQGAIPCLATFGAIAAKRARDWRRPELIPELLHALWCGWTGKKHDYLCEATSWS